jgi:hypothetical protein
MKNLTQILCLTFLFSCTPEAKEELNAVNNEATFQKNVKNFMDFTKEFKNENIDGVMNMFADSAQWSPPEYNSYTWKTKDELRDGLLNYMNSFDDLTFTPGINLPGENVVDGFWGGSRYRSDGNENTSSSSSSNPNNLRIYGTWSSIHTESGKKTYSKWYAIVNFNEAGKIVRFNDWFNVDGLQVQIND